MRDRGDAHWFAVGTVCIGAFMGQLDASIVTQAFPSLQRAFGASIGDVQWVGLAYLITLVSLVTAMGGLADVVGRKLLYLYGFGVFILGSTLCGFSHDLLVLDGFRVLQAAGAAMLQANSVAIIVLAVPRARLGHAVGLQGAAQAIGLSLGPTIGGLLIALGGWPLIFFVNLPIGVVGILMGVMLIPRSKHLVQRRRFDWVGLGLFVVAVGSLFGAVSFGNQLGWGSPPILAALMDAGVISAVFLWHERRVDEPMLDLALFRRARFSLGIAAGLLSYVVLFGLLFITPYFLERGLHQRVAQAGLELTAMPLTIAVVAPVAGRIADHFGPRLLSLMGMLLAGAGCAAFALAHPSPAPVVVELAIVGAGLGCFTPANNASILGSIPRQQTGAASGILNMARGTGTAVGLAVTGLVFGLGIGVGSDAMIGTASAVAAAFLATVAFAASALTLGRDRGPTVEHIARVI